jgi:hypothetical protein
MAFHVIRTRVSAANPIGWPGVPRAVLLNGTNWSSRLRRLMQRIFALRRDLNRPSRPNVRPSMKIRSWSSPVQAEEAYEAGVWGRSPQDQGARHAWRIDHSSIRALPLQTWDAHGGVPKRFASTALSPFERCGPAHNAHGRSELIDTNHDRSSNLIARFIASSTFSIHAIAPCVGSPGVGFIAGFFIA